MFWRYHYGASALLIGIRLIGSSRLFFRRTSPPYATTPDAKSRIWVHSAPSCTDNSLKKPLSTLSPRPRLEPGVHYNTRGSEFSPFFIHYFLQRCSFRGLNECKEEEQNGPYLNRTSSDGNVNKRRCRATIPFPPRCHQHFLPRGGSAARCSLPGLKTRPTI